MPCTEVGQVELVVLERVEVYEGERVGRLDTP